MSSPSETLAAGTGILDPLMTQAGFSFTPERKGSGSGGAYASGSYRRGERSLELHFRRSLGLITYRIGASRMDHLTYMRYLGVAGRAQYPGFSDDPLDGFRHLLHDLTWFCGDFLSGSGTEFHALASQHEREPERFRGLP